MFAQYLSHTHGTAFQKLPSFGKVLFFATLPASRTEQAVYVGLGAPLFVWTKEEELN